MHPDARLYALIGDLTELSTVLGAMLRDTDRVEPSWAAACENFEHSLRFERLTNNLRDGWRLTEAAGLPGAVSSPATAEERLAAAPFARLIAEADNLLAVACEFTDDDADTAGGSGRLVWCIPDYRGPDDTAPAEAFAQFAELREALASTVAALAELIAGLMLGRVTLPPFLEGDELAFAEEEAEALVGRPSRCAAGDA